MTDIYPKIAFEFSDDPPSLGVFVFVGPKACPAFREVVMSFIKTPPLAKPPYYPTPIVAYGGGFACRLVPDDFEGEFPPEDVIKQMCYLHITEAYNRALNPSKQDLAALLVSPDRSIREYAIRHSSEWMKRIQAEEAND